MPTYIFGTGIHGKAFLQGLQKEEIEIAGFIDDFSNEESCMGLPVIRANQVKDPNSKILISVGLISRQIKERLVRLGFNHTLDFTQSAMQHPAVVKELKPLSMWFSKKAEEMVDQAGINTLRRLLEDEKSKIILENIVKFRLDEEGQNYVAPDDGPQYFAADTNFLGHADRLRFVDGGAYTGDTTRSLITACKEQNKTIDFIACFEPDPSNRKTLMQTLRIANSASKPVNHIIFPGCLWSDSRILPFSTSGSTSSHIATSSQNKTTELVSCFSLDETLYDMKPNLIKLDIEGAETQAIKGAENIIRDFKPAMAICLYHRPSDLWEIPIRITRLSEDYSMHIRVYGDMLLETVLYCIPRQ